MMGRPNKKGLDYFPVDVNFFEDQKIQFVSATFGLTGEAIVLRLLAMIYKNGYFIEWDDDHATLFRNRIGNQIEQIIITNILSELFKRKFFEERMYQQHRVLTSIEIQEQYLTICASAKRKNAAIRPEFDLLQSKPGYLPEETQITHELIRLTLEESTQSKINKSIVEKSKEQNSKVEESKTNQTKEEESKSSIELNSTEKQVESLQDRIRNLVKLYDRDSAKYLTEDIIERYGYQRMSDFLTESEEVSAMYANNELLLYTNFKKWIGNQKGT